MNKKRMKDTVSSVIVEIADNNQREETISFMSNSITQDMAYRQSLMKYTEKYGVSRASRKYNKSRSYIYFWKARWDGSIQSLACRSRRPHSHPNQHTEAELKLIRDMRRRNPTLGMVELWHRLLPITMTVFMASEPLLAPICQWLKRMAPVNICI